MAIAKKQEPTTIQIPRPKIEIAKFRVTGTSPLIFHKWDQKAIDMILNKQLKKELKGREARLPVQEYQSSFYFDNEGHIAFPANSFKQAVVDSARNLEGVTMTLLRGSLFIVGDAEGMIPVLVNGKPVKLTETVEEKVAENVVGYDKKTPDIQMRQDMVRVGMGSADIRFRGQAKNWSMDLIVKYNSALLSTEQLASLIQYAGFSCGLGEWRPQRNGDFGTFELSE